MHPGFDWLHIHPHDPSQGKELNPLEIRYEKDLIENLLSIQSSADSFSVNGHCL